MNLKMNLKIFLLSVAIITSQSIIFDTFTYKRKFSELDRKLLVSFKGSIEDVKAALNEGANPNAQYDDDVGITLLMILIGREDVPNLASKIKLLLDAGADVYLQDKVGTSVLQLAPFAPPEIRDLLQKEAVESMLRRLKILQRLDPKFQENLRIPFLDYLRSSINR